MTTWTGTYEAEGNNRVNDIAWLAAAGNVPATAIVQISAGIPSSSAASVGALGPLGGRIPVEGGNELAGRLKKLFLYRAARPPAVVTGDADVDTGILDPTVHPVATKVLEPGLITPGVHWYYYTFYNAIGETAPIQAQVAVDVSNANQAQVDLAFSRGPEGAGLSQTLGRILYRSRANETKGWRLVVIQNNDDTTYRDNVPDSQLEAVTTPVHNGTRSVHQITRPPADWHDGNQPAAGFILEGRMAAFGNNNGLHMLYVSSLIDHEDFLSDPLTFPVFSGQGEKIIAGIYWRGQGWLWKRPRGIYRIDSRQLNPLDWQVHEHSKAVGCAGPRALTLVRGQARQQFFDDVLFLAPDGSWHRLSKTAAYQEGDVNASSISYATFGEFIRENVEKTRLEAAQMIYFDEIEEVWAALTLRGGSLNTLRIKANLKRLEEYGIRFHHSTFPECEALALKINADFTVRPMAGGSGGFVRELAHPSYSDAGVAYQSEWWTHDDDFGELGDQYRLNMKNFHWLIVEGISAGDWPITVEVYIDGLYRYSLQFSMLGKDTGFVLDRDLLDVAAVGTLRPLFGQRRLRGRGRRIAFRAYVNTQGQFFKISRIQVGFSLGGFSGAKST